MTTDSIHLSREADAGLRKSEFSPAEEIANGVTHGVGAALSIVGVFVLMTVASSRGDAWHVIGCSIFGATLVLLYLASTLYHSIRHTRTKLIFRALDHTAIYLLIAGTYTPFLLVNLRGPWGWSLLGVIWGLALLGIVFRFSLWRRSEVACVALYLAMGWTALVAVKPLLSSVELGGLVLVLLGGITYTAGVAFYAWSRLPYNHAIWHGFVLAGSAFHFFAVLHYVLPVASVATL